MHRCDDESFHPISFPGFDAGERDVRAERVAKLHRPEPVEFEEAVEVTPSADPGEPRRADALVLCKGNMFL